MISTRSIHKKIIAVFFIATLFFTSVPNVASAGWIEDFLVSVGAIQECPIAGFYMPGNEDCTANNNPIFPSCMVAVLTASVASVFFLSWNPPLMIFAFGGIFIGGMLLCQGQYPPLPDLTAAAVTANGVLQQGSSVTFRGRVTNDGKAAITRSFTNRFEYRWGTSGAWTPLNTLSIASLGIGSRSSALTSSAVALSRSGTLQVRLCADRSSVIMEAIESNNCGRAVSFPVTAVPALPNLTAVNLSVNPSGTVMVGDVVTVGGAVRNTGGADAGASSARFCLNNASCLTSTTGRMGTDESIGALTVNRTSSVITRTWTPTATGTYTIRLCADTGNAVTESNESDNCSGTGGSSSSITITVIPRPVVANPTAMLQVRNTTTGGGWSSASPFRITAGHQIELDWRGTNSTSCNGTNFNTGGSTDNSTTNVTEPTVGSSTTYSVSCDDNNNATPADTAQIRVEAIATLPDLTASKTTVLTGEPFTLTWNLNGNDPLQCVITGAGSTRDDAGEITTQTGNMNLNAQGTSTYTLRCPGGTDSITIDVLPQVYES